MSRNFGFCFLSEIYIDWFNKTDARRPYLCILIRYSNLIAINLFLTRFSLFIACYFGCNLSKPTYHGRRNHDLNNMLYRSPRFELLTLTLTLRITNQKPDVHIIVETIIMRLSEIKQYSFRDVLLFHELCGCNISSSTSRQFKYVVYHCRSKIKTEKVF